MEVREAGDSIPSLNESKVKAMPKTVIGAGSWIGTYNPGTVHVNAAMKADILRGVLYICSVGLVRYKDVFGQAWYTKILLRYGGPGAEDGQMEPCADGNEAT